MKAINMSSSIGQMVELSHSEQLCIEGGRVEQAETDASPAYEEGYEWGSSCGRALKIFLFVLSVYGLRSL
jgi:hypothetical protein